LADVVGGAVEGATEGALNVVAAAAGKLAGHGDADKNGAEKTADKADKKKPTAAKSKSK